MRHREERVRSETTLTHKRNLRILCIFIYGFWCSYRDGDGSQPAAYVRIFFAFARSTVRECECVRSAWMKSFLQHLRARVAAL